MAIFIIVVGINAGVYFHYLNTAYESNISVYCVLFGLPLLLNDSICLLVLMHVWEIRHGFSVLNECLKRMQMKNRSAWFKNKPILKQKLWIPNVENLTTIGTVHLELNNCITEFNNSFGVLLVSKFVVSFVATLIGVYFTYVNYLLSMPMKTLYSAMLAFKYSANSAILCQSCSATVKKVVTILITMQLVCGE